MNKFGFCFIVFALAAQLCIEASLLQINQETLLTDTNGVINLSQIASLTVNKQVKIYRSDGTVYTGRVTEIEETPSHYKVFGTISNIPDSYFGFSLISGGTFVGAIVEKTTDHIYTAEFSLDHKGFILLRSFKYSRPGA